MQGSEPCSRCGSGNMQAWLLQAWLLLQATCQVGVLFERHFSAVVCLQWQQCHCFGSTVLSCRCCDSVGKIEFSSAGNCLLWTPCMCLVSDHCASLHAYARHQSCDMLHSSCAAWLLGQQALLIAIHGTDTVAKSYHNSADLLQCIHS